MDNATLTAEGWVPHVRHPNLGILMPVKLSTDGATATQMEKPLPPKRRGRFLVYALPHGRECVKDW